MKFTNVNNLPAPFVNLVINSYARKPSYDSFGVTELIDAPLIKRLKIDRWDDITVDVSDYVWMVIGNAAHYILEKGATNLDAEKYTKVHIDGINVAWKPDLVHDGRITDYKVTSVWSFMLGEKEEWVNQLNCYAALERKFKNNPIRSLVIECILRDWRRGEIFKYDTYPKIPWHTIELNVKDTSDALDYLYSRIHLHRDCVGKQFEELPICTEKEMWEKPPKFAVLKDGANRAMRVFDNGPDAEKFLLDKKLDSRYNIVRRPGERVKCQYFCVVRSVCPYNIQTQND